MESSIDDLRQLIDSGDWKQGSILPDELIEILKANGFLKGIANGDVLVVLTHDCDLLHDSIEDEPFIEIITGKWGTGDSRYEHGKNPRTLHIRDESNSNRALIFRPSCREFAPREVLCKVPCKSCLPSKSTETLATWVGERYSRSSLPDAFLRRITKEDRKALKALFKKVSGYVTGVFLAIDDGELPPDKDYEIVIDLTVASETAQDASVMTQVEVFAADLAAKMDEIEGVTVINYVVKSHAEFSLDDILETRRFNL